MTCLRRSLAYAMRAAYLRLPAPRIEGVPVGEPADEVEDPADEVAREVSAMGFAFPDDSTIAVGAITIGVYLDSDGDKSWSYRLAGLTSIESVGYLQTLATMMAIDASGGE